MQRWVRMTLVLAILIGLSYPATAQGKKKITSLDLYLKIGARYDENVRLEAFDVDLFADDEDTAAVVYFSGRYRFIKRKQFEASAGYAHYQIVYRDISEYDVLGSIGQFNAKYKWRDFTFGLAYQPSYYQVDHQRFIMYHQIKPDVTWQVRKNLVARFNYSNTDNNNFQEDRRDGSTKALNLDFYYIISKKGHYLFSGIGHDRNDAAHNDYDWKRAHFKLGGSFNLPRKVQLVATGKWDDKSYENVDSFFAIARQDKKYFLSLSASRPLFYDWLSVILDYNYTLNDSNIADYEYDKHEMTLSLAARY